MSGQVTTHLRKQMPDEDRLRCAAALFSLVADCQRLKILFALRTVHELYVGEVARVLGVSVSVASHHLGRLRDVGIVEARSDGKLAYYRLRDRVLADLAVAATARIR